MRNCSNKICPEVNPQSLTNFQRATKTKHGCQSRCKTCRGKYYKDNAKEIIKQVAGWGKRNPDKIRVYERNYRMKALYGLLPGQYETMAAQQHNKCLICLREKKLVVDHDHETGKVRGLLCNLCNSGMGHLKDSIEHLQNAINYLKDSQNG